MGPIAAYIAPVHHNAMIPESGTRDEFKEAVFKILPPKKLIFYQLKKKDLSTVGIYLSARDAMKAMRERITPKENSFTMVPVFDLPG